MVIANDDVFFSFYFVSPHTTTHALLLACLELFLTFWGGFDEHTMTATFAFSKFTFSLPNSLNKFPIRIPLELLMCLPCPCNYLRSPFTIYLLLNLMLKARRTS